MILPTIMFYLFAVVAVASGVMVVSAKNPVHSVLFLILAFFNSAGLFVLIGALIGFILLAELMLVFGSWAIAPGIAGLKAAALPANATALTNTRALGDL